MDCLDDLLLKADMEDLLREFLSSLPIIENTEDKLGAVISRFGRADEQGQFKEDHSGFYVEL